MSSTADHSKFARREMARRARDAFPPMGVYIVRDRETGQVLVASSRNVHGAINRVKFELRLRSHSNRALQVAWDQGGPERLDFEVVDLLKERSDPEFDYGAELRALEKFYREIFQQQEEPDLPSCQRP